jgi:hypothetical protein
MSRFWLIKMRLQLIGLFCVGAFSGVEAKSYTFHFPSSVINRHIRNIARIIHEKMM